MHALHALQEHGLKGHIGVVHEGKNIIVQSVAPPASLDQKV